MGEKFEKGICLTTCICQLTAMFCGVSILYLVILIHNHPHRTLNMRFSEDTVMCTTVSNVTVQCDSWEGYPPWSSCREGCLSIHSVWCHQILVDVRRNGSNIRLEECDPAELHSKYCTSYHSKLDVNECNHGECASLQGLFEEQCIDINTNQKDILIREGDTIHTAKCARSRDIETGIKVWPRELRSIKDPWRPPMLMVFCTTLLEAADDDTTYIVSDCFNGTLLELDHFGSTTNITHGLTSHYESMERLVDLERRFMPPEEDLLISEWTPLQINQDGCVRNGAQECERFLEEHGRDGSVAPVRSQSRFQCHRDPNNSHFVVVRFNGADNNHGLMIYAAVPVALAIISCFMCFLRTTMIHVGDKSRRHFCFGCCAADPTVVSENEGDGSAK